jgi:hypothetical protein
MKIADRYLLPYDELAFTLGSIAALSLVLREGRWRLVGVLLTVAVVASEGVGSVEVVRQAMAPSISARCAEVLQAIARPERDRILAANLSLVGVPIDMAASDEDYRRDERLAKKYGVKLGERAEEKKSHRDQAARGFYVRPLPFALGGMEDLDQKVAESAVKPYWWPIQEEEWDLDYRTAQGFNIFVVSDETGPGISGIPAYRTLYQQIKERCEQVAVLPCRRQLFSEQEVRIYRLRDRGKDPNDR